MIRKIIQIDEEKCTGCGICADACHEGAIGIVDGKAKLLRDDYCDGFGDCLPTCPTGAITFIEREAAAYDEEAVKENMKKKESAKAQAHGMGCPGATARALNPGTEDGGVVVGSKLTNWPVQIKLAPVSAPYFDGADLLIAADCTAYAYGNFHQKFMNGKVTLIGCPKLDDINYADKLTDIIKTNDIKSITLTRMEVPCCGGLEMMLKSALAASGKTIPLEVVTIGINGNILR